MQRIQLDLGKLLGFRALKSDVLRGAKTGAKPGAKAGAKAGAKIGAKIGVKT